MNASQGCCSAASCCRVRKEIISVISRQVPSSFPSALPSTTKNNKLLLGRAAELQTSGLASSYLSLSATNRHPMLKTSPLLSMHPAAWAFRPPSSLNHMTTFVRPSGRPSKREKPTYSMSHIEVQHTLHSSSRQNRNNATIMPIILAYQLAVLARRVRIISEGWEHIDCRVAR